jgi:hypothetical protein
MWLKIMMKNVPNGCLRKLIKNEDADVPYKGTLLVPEKKELKYGFQQMKSMMA